MFKIIQGNGFQITFDNKYTVWVHWGPDEQSLAEISVYGKDGYGILTNGKHILGLQSPEQVADLIATTAKRQPPKSTTQ